MGVGKIMFDCLLRDCMTYEKKRRRDEIYDL